MSKVNTDNVWVNLVYKPSQKLVLFAVLLAVQHGTSVNKSKYLFHAADQRKDPLLVFSPPPRCRKLDSGGKRALSLVGRFRGLALRKSSTLGQTVIFSESTASQIKLFGINDMFLFFKIYFLVCRGSLLLQKVPAHVWVYMLHSGTNFIKIVVIATL